MSNDTPIDDQQLAKEVDYLHRCLFDRAVPEEVRRQYVDAHHHLCVSRRGARPVDIAAIMAKGLDAEAIEYYLRLQSPNNVLTRKLRILLYLLELRSDYYHRFVRERGSFITAAPRLGLAAVRSALKLLRGAQQARRHHVV